MLLEHLDLCPLRLQSCPRGAKVGAAAEAAQDVSDVVVCPDTGRKCVLPVVDDAVDDENAGVVNVFRGNGLAGLRCGDEIADGHVGRWAVYVGSCKR